jgi:UDPglucose 6-dehydrogenase/GDP-mannose 6-dehydrogenase
MRISVIGTGYVGLVSGLGLASVGHKVVCYDLNPDIVNTLNSGIPTIHEEGLDSLLKQLLQSGNISFELLTSESLSSSDVILIAVGTPSKDGNIDLSFIRSAAKSAGESLNLSNQPVSIIVKSTVTPGTTSVVVRQEVKAVLEKPNRDFGLGMNPEFLREGSAISDFQNPDRIIFGHEDQIALEHLREMYESFECPKIEVNIKTAELTKYANNFFLALQISASNEIANLASKLGDIDPLEVMGGVLSDRRWSGDWQKGETPHGIGSYLKPGPGFGGSCFPKDVEALISLGEEVSEKQTIAQAVLDVNRIQPKHVADLLLGENFEGKKVLILGLAFKPDTDDVRESPASGFIAALVSRDIKVQAHDPIAIQNFQTTFSQVSSLVTFVSDWKSAALEVDVIVLLTPWQEYVVGVPNLRAEQLTLVDPRRAIPQHSLSPNWTYKSLGIDS